MGWCERFRLLGKHNIQNLSYVFTANAFNSLIGFLVSFLVARHYGHEVFALYSIAVHVTQTVTVLTDSGTNLSMVRLYKLYIEDAERAGSIILANAVLKVSSLILLLIIVALFSESIGQLLTQRSGAEYMVGLAMMSGGIIGVFMFINSYCQANETFRVMAVMTAVYAVARIVFFYFAPVTGGEDWLAGRVLAMTYTYPVLAAIATGCAFIGYKPLMRLRMYGHLKISIGRVLSYSKWLAVSIISVVLMTRGMLFVISATCDMYEVAILSAGLLFSGAFVIVNDSARQVLLPKVSSMELPRIKAYNDKLMRVMPLYAVFSISVILALTALMYFGLGSRYAGAIPVFLVLASSRAIVTWIGFYSIMFHAIMKPDVDAVINIITGCFGITIIICAIPRYGVMGAAVAYAVISIAGETVKAYTLLYLINKEVSDGIAG